MATTSEIIKGISQVMANTYDGALDKEGNRLKTGLKRDEEVPISDRRLIDGFKVKLLGNKLKLVYHSEARMEQIHDPKFKDEIKQTISDVVSFLKKEFKKETGEALSLKEVDDIDIETNNTSMVRVWVVATCTYEIGNIKYDHEDRNKKDLEKSVKDWLGTGKEKFTGTKEPENDLR